MNDVADRLEEIVRDLEGRPGASALMREHLESARSYLLGAMPQEYEFNLKLALDLLPQIEEEALRQRIAGFLNSQQKS